MVTSTYEILHYEIFPSRILHPASEVKIFSSGFLKSLLSTFPSLILEAKLGMKDTLYQMFL